MIRLGSWIYSYNIAGLVDTYYRQNTQVENFSRKLKKKWLKQGDFIISFKSKKAELSS